VAAAFTPTLRATANVRLYEPVSVPYRIGLGRAKTEIGKSRAETGATNPSLKGPKCGNCRAETPTQQPNPPGSRRFSHVRKLHHRDWTVWLGREESNLRMAESKSDYFSCKINAHSEKIAKFDPLYTNRLAAHSECWRPPPRRNLRQGQGLPRRSTMICWRYTRTLASTAARGQNRSIIIARSSLQRSNNPQRIIRFCVSRQANGIYDRDGPARNIPSACRIAYIAFKDAAILA
jgi:hypothetical protein